MINQAEHAIISKLRDLISANNLAAGDRFPAELALSEKFNVSRRNIRSAISILESYELVKKIPQSGTIIGNIGHISLVGILDNILELSRDDFKSLLEMRVILEISTVKMAAERRSKTNLKQIEEKFNQYKEKTLQGEDATQEDILFHLSIAKACGNPTLNSLMLQITPKLMSVFKFNRIASKARFQSDITKEESEINSEEEFAREIEIHEAIFRAIHDRKPELAVQSMENHFKIMLKEVI